jgi:hypothetical protein
MPNCAPGALCTSFPDKELVCEYVRLWGWTAVRARIRGSSAYGPASSSEYSGEAASGTPVEDKCVRDGWASAARCRAAGFGRLSHAIPEQNVGIAVSMGKYAAWLPCFESHSQAPSKMIRILFSPAYRQRGSGTGTNPECRPRRAEGTCAQTCR